jgi:hypothetical protein
MCSCSLLGRTSGLLHRATGRPIGAGPRASLSLGCTKVGSPIIVLAMPLNYQSDPKARSGHAVNLDAPPMRGFFSPTPGGRNAVPRTVERTRSLLASPSCSPGASSGWREPPGVLWLASCARKAAILSGEAEAPRRFYVSEHAEK